MNLLDDILRHLEKHGSLSTLEIQLLTGIKGNSVRARISELRKKGHVIKSKYVNTKKYVLVSDTNMFEEYIVSNDAFGVPISIKELSEKLRVTQNDLKVMISQLFKKYSIVQLTTDTVIVNNWRKEQNERTKRGRIVEGRIQSAGMVF